MPTTKEIIEKGVVRHIVEQFKAPELVVAFLRNLNNERINKTIDLVEKLDEIGENKSLAMLVLALINLGLQYDPDSPLAKLINDHIAESTAASPPRIAADTEAAINRFYTRLKDFDIEADSLILRFGLDINVETVGAVVNTDDNEPLLAQVDRDDTTITVTIPLDLIKTAKTARLGLRLLSSETGQGESLRREFNDTDSYDLTKIVLQKRELFGDEDLLDRLLDEAEGEAPGFQAENSSLGEVMYRVAMPNSAKENSEMPIGVKSTISDQRFGIVVKGPDNAALFHYGFESGKELRTGPDGKGYFKVRLPAKNETGDRVTIEVWLTRDDNQVKLGFPVLIDSTDEASSTE